MRTSISDCLRHTSIAKNGSWRIYQATMNDWRQICNFKRFRVQIVNVSTIFWLNLQATSNFFVVSIRLMLPKDGGWQIYRTTMRKSRQIRKWFLTHNKSIRVEIEMFQPIFADFQTTSKFVINFVRLILGKVGIDRFTKPWQEIDIRYRFGLEVILKGLGFKQIFLKSFLIKFPIIN